VFPPCSARWRGVCRSAVATQAPTIRPGGVNERRASGCFYSPLNTRRWTLRKDPHRPSARALRGTRPSYSPAPSRMCARRDPFEAPWTRVTRRMSPANLRIPTRGRGRDAKTRICLVPQRVLVIISYLFEKPLFSAIPGNHYDNHPRGPYAGSGCDSALESLLRLQRAPTPRCV